MSLNEKLSPTHPVIGDEYRLLEGEDVIEASDEMSWVSTLLSMAGDQWYPVGDAWPDLGKSISWCRHNSEDMDRGERVFRRHIGAARRS